MSDVRGELMAVIAERFVWGHPKLADAILERFEVTPKPVISEGELGLLVRGMSEDINHPAVSSVSIGADLLDALDRRGLQIVRKEAGK